MNARPHEDRRGELTEASARIDTWMDRVRTMAGHFSVRTKILGIVLALIALLGLGITWQVRTAMIAVIANELDNHGQAQISEIAERVSDPLSRNDTDRVSEILDETVAYRPDIMYAYVAGPDGNIVAATFSEDDIPPGVASIEDPGVARSVQHVDTDGEQGSVHSFSARVGGGDIGVAWLGLSEARLSRAVDGITLQLLMTTLFLGVVGIAAATLLTWLLTRPILDLVDTTDRVARGDLSARAYVWAEDEIGSLANSFNRMVGELESNRATIAENDLARSRLLKQIIGAQEDERKRIARELHDTVGQALTSIMLGASLIVRSEASPEATADAERVRDIAAETLEQVRQLSRELRPSVLDDLGLAAALDRYVADFQVLYPEIETEVHCNLPVRLPPAVETTLYRIVQEGMTNVARHSGARALSVLVVSRDGCVRTIIEDDGIGFDPVAVRRNGQSVGIHGMVERSELLGGRLDIESGEDGTTVYVEVPVPAPVEVNE